MRVQHEHSVCIQKPHLLSSPHYGVAVLSSPRYGAAVLSSNSPFILRLASVFTVNNSLVFTTLWRGCSFSSPCYGVAVLSSPRYGVAVLSSPCYGVAVLSSPRYGAAVLSSCYGAAVLSSPRYGAAVLSSRYGVAVLSSPCYGTAVLSSKSPFIFTNRDEGGQLRMDSFGGDGMESCYGKLLWRLG